MATAEQRAIKSTAIDVREFGVVGDGSTDNATALIALRDYCIGVSRSQHWHWTFPPGVYHYTNNRWLVGLLNIRVSGYGASLRCTSTGTYAGDYWWFGPREGIFRGNGEELISGSTFIVQTGHRIDSANAGATTIDLTTTGDASNYAAGDKIFLHGYCMQSTGYSPNLRFFEWAEIDSISSGELTLTKPLQNTYDEDWCDHLYLSARTVGSLTITDQYVGKPRIISLSGTPQSDGSTYYYPTSVVIEGFKLLKHPTSENTSRGVMSGHGIIWRDIELEDIDDVAADERESEQVLWERCKFPRGKEIDKLNGQVTIRGGYCGNEPDSVQSINAGTGVNRLILEGVDCAGKISALARDGTFIRGCSASGAYVSNAATQGPLMPGDPSEYAGGQVEISGCTLTRLSNQPIIGTNALTWASSSTGVNASNSAITVTWDDAADPPAILRRTYPGQLAWLSSNPLVRGRVVSVKDVGSDSLEVVFGGSLGYGLASGAVTGAVSLVGPNAERTIIDGELQPLPGNLSPHPGLLKWEDVTIDSPWTLSATTLTGNTGASGNKVSWPGILTVGKSYTLTYDITTTSGAVFVRNSGSGSNLASLNGTSTGSTATFTAVGVDLEFRNATFNGTIVPVSLKEA